MGKKSRKQDGESLSRCSAAPGGASAEAAWSEFAVAEGFLAAVEFRLSESGPLACAFLGDLILLLSDGVQSNFLTKKKS